MAGHSKWANIKRKKAKGDAARGNVFTKIGREIAIAVKMGGPDPNNNTRLRDAIAKAKANNMPNDNINRGIKKAAGELDTVNYEDIIYEGYGAGGVAFIVETLTDNKNRTAGDVRHIFDKYGGSMGTTNCVSFMFKRKGVIIIDRSIIAEDDLMLMAIEGGADDIVTDEEIYEVYTMPTDLGKVREYFESNDIAMLSAEFDMVPDNEIEPDEKHIDSLNKMIEKFEELDDVQNVFHNAILPEEDE